MQQLTVGEDVFKLPCFSLAGCTEIPLFWEGGKQALKTGAGLEEKPAVRLHGSADSDFVVS